MNLLKPFGIFYGNVKLAVHPSPKSRLESTISGHYTASCSMYKFEHF